MEHKNPDVSVIIVNYNNRAYLCKTLESLFRDSWIADYEIFVVDNASEDDSVQTVERSFPAVKVIVLPENIGFSGANNRGAAQASGRYLLFLNNDTQVPEGTIGKLIEVKKNHPEYGIVAPLILYPDESLQLSWGSDLHLHTEAFLKFFAEKWHRWRYGRMRGRMNRDVDWVSGACFVMERDLYRKIGGFDENFFLYVEDADLGRRVRRLGHKIHVTSEARVIHYRGQSVAKMKGRALLEAKRSQLYYYCKHNSRREFAVLRRYLLFRFGLNRWRTRRRGKTETREICTRVMDMIREFRCEDPA